MVRESGHELPKNRQDMLLGILDLERVTVDDIMIPHAAEVPRMSGR